MNAQSLLKCIELGISPDSIKMRNLRECEEATDLEVAEVGADGKAHFLIAAAAQAWRELKAAALRDGIQIIIISAFRNIDRQADIISRKLASGVPLEEILAVSAPPGFSEHHTGRAIDVNTPGTPALELEFDRTAAFAWLNKQAAQFGYHLSYPNDNQRGYQYEPWHWYYENASSK